MASLTRPPCPGPAPQAARLFGRIRAAVAGQAAPATLKAAFLEPLGAGALGAELAVELCGRADDGFMQLFTGGRGGRWRGWGWVGSGGCRAALAG